jgi:multisubunit Na+/H+ antiporter MnhG subunit
MERSQTQDLRTLGVALIFVGAILAASAVVCAFAAADHMALAATLCGPVTGHCILCALLAANLLASAGAAVGGVMLLRGRRDPLRQRAT